MADAPQTRPAPTRTAPPQTAAKSAERVAQRAASAVQTEPIAIPRTGTATAVDAKKRPGLKMEEAIITAGTAGEHNIVLEKFWVEVEGNMPCGFDVATRAGNGLEVTLEQLSYRKVHTGTGALNTSVAPVAPIGTKGRLIVRDTTTGETVEQPWTWHLIGGGSGLWALLKRLLWKG